MFIQSVEIIILLLLSFISDYKTLKIKNHITLSFTALGIITGIMQKGLEGLALSILGWCLPVLLLFVLYALKMLGAGDVKMFGAIGSIAGYGFAMHSILYSFIFGGLAGIGLLIVRKNAGERFRYFGTYMKSCFLVQKPMEYSNSGSENKRSVFRFTYAAVPGVLAQLAFAVFG